MNLPFSGACACGAIRYESTAAPVMMFNCHCRDCQRSSGGAFASILIVPTTALTLVQGSPTYYRTESEGGGRIHRGFCAQCGSPVLAKFETISHLMGIRAVSLEDPSWFRPQWDIWTCDAQPWDHMDPTVPKFEQYPPFDETERE